MHWPSEVDADSTVVLGVFAAEDVTESLEAVLLDARVGGRSIQIERHPDPGMLPPGSIVFVTEAHEDRAARFLAWAYGQPMLLVGESEAFLTRGGVVRFVTIKNKVRFSVNLAAADRQRLRLSSKLLAVAREVLPSQVGEGARQ